MTPLHLHRPTEADLPVKDEHAAARAVVKLNDPTHPDLPRACEVLESGDWVDRNFAELGRDILAERTQSLARDQVPILTLCREMVARDQVPETRQLTDAEWADVDLPRFAGLQTGEVVARWETTLDPVDRWLWLAVKVVVLACVVGIVGWLGTLLLGGV